MEIQQEIVEEVEKLITTAEAIKTSVSNMQAFFKAPRDKTEIMEFIQLNLIEKMYEGMDFKCLVIRLLNVKSIYNTQLMGDRLIYGSENEFTLGYKFFVQYRLTIDKLFKFMLQLKEEISKLPYDDLVERDIALRRSYLRLLTVINANVPVIIQEEQYPELTISDYDHISYMTMTYEELQKEIDYRLWRVEDLRNTYPWTDRAEFSAGSENNLKSLLNFVIYLGSLVRY